MSFPAARERTTARVWNHSFDLVGHVEPSSIQDREGEIVLDRNDPVAKFLTEPTGKPKWLTTDGPTGRWTGRLKATHWLPGDKRTSFTFEPLPSDQYGFQKSYCADCGELIYSGIWIPQSDLEDLHRIHNTTHA